MKEKELYKERYHGIMVQMMELEDRLKKSEVRVDTDKDMMSSQVLLLEDKNQEYHDKIVAI